MSFINRFHAEHSTAISFRPVTEPFSAGRNGNEGSRKYTATLAAHFRKAIAFSMSSDALLMNIFCYPGVTKRRELSLMLGTEIGDLPEFGFKPRIPLTSGFVERTEIDMKLGSVLFEAKLTE